MDFSFIASEDRIRRAYEDGEFNELPGLGKPMKLEDLSAIPEELRMAYKMLKNAGYAQEESQLRKEMMSIEDLIRKCEDPDEKQGLQRKLNQKLHRFNGMMAKKGVQTNSSIFKNYEQKIYTKMDL
ncbi:DUF1992 domain-containing protein [Neobacillus sp. PS3-34]|uniref:DnaJ family domain-containing protein n=1 Tax=Neobacillus sp. PS3-34 TaxID=3070678 RepID=UPI0027E20B6D|nr:DUF1992 domain-containing protein [Neobacillus sp. PS3-34]WML49875.1 DUF1992 domain-containing protein [Neobacillus sp. PS3-34]